MAQKNKARAPKYRRYRRRRRGCFFCKEGMDDIDYKDVDLLSRFVTKSGRIEPRRRTGTCAKHQRLLTKAIKRARHLALLPFSPKHVQR